MEPYINIDSTFKSVKQEFKLKILTNCMSKEKTVRFNSKMSSIIGFFLIVASGFKVAILFNTVMIMTIYTSTSIEVTLRESNLIQ